ncbi:PilW family protein [Noviherbaspirillum massiliense]|uniref:PilW family protein n=1 Tax=Noviherbaspirillum massiliense TaxID=1465823 RepID=UPI0002D8B6F7|nr:PilW family protein [Noviherbaspirillum massiliense]
MVRKPQSFLHRAAGLGLVEIMVGLAIGSFAAIVMLQVFAMSEGRKRTTTSGGDAQSNGIIAFNQLQRDISQAGYGIAALNLFNCNTTWTLGSGTTSITNPVRLAPVTINPGTIPAGDANTDTLLVVYGNTDGQPQGNNILSQDGAKNTVQMPTAFAVGDRVIIAPAACSSNLLIDRVTATATTTVTVTNAATGTAMYNLGNSPSILAYAVRGGNLTVCDYMVNDCGKAADKDKPSVWVPVANNIISIKAVYWRDTKNPTGTPGSRNQTTPTDNLDWTKVCAVNLALVARSGEYSKDIVTATARNAPQPVNAPTWSDNAAAPIIGTGSLGPDAVPDEPWKHYRYKVFEAVIPIRNVGWMQGSAGC